MDVRGYTFRRKLAIATWSTLTLVSIIATILVRQVIMDGIDFYIHVTLQLMSNMVYGHRDLIFNIPLLEPLLAAFAAFTAYAGAMMILKILIPPPIKTHKVVIHPFTNLND